MIRVVRGCALILCALASIARAEIVVVDDVGNEIVLQQPAERIVSLAPHVTEVLYEAGAGETFDRYLAQAERNYEVGMEHFVYTDRSRLRDFVDLDVLRNARGLTLLGSMADHVANYFEHPKLRQLVQYSLVFLGGSPKNTPALYSLMSHVDFGLGVHYPEGGMAAVVDAVVLVINVWFFAVLILAILSWISPGGPNPVAEILERITDPVLRPVRRVVPLVGGIDLSPLVVLIGLQVLKMLIVRPLLALA